MLVAFMLPLLKFSIKEVAHQRLSSAYAATRYLFEEFQRIDGGSDSPTPNDDASVHSVSDAGFEHDATMKQVLLVFPFLS